MLETKNKIHFLNNSSINIDDDIFIGTTLWSFIRNKATCNKIY